MMATACQGVTAELVALAGSVLGDVRVAEHADASFVRLGGDSLRAMRLAAEALDRLGVALPVRELLSARPLSSVLARAAGSGTGAPSPKPVRAALVSSSVASAAQRGMWIGDQVVGSAPYHLVFTCLIDGPLRRDVLVAALAATVRRHEGLRTTFTENGGTLERRVLPAFVPPVVDVDSPAGFDHQVRAVVAGQGRQPFDLGSVPPLRFVLVRGGTDEHALVLAAHHILLDGWAIGSVLEEVFARYDAIERGRDVDRPPGVGFDVYLERHERLRESGELDRQAAFWRDQLSGVPTVLDLPADRTRPAFQEPHGARVDVDLGAAVSAAVVRRAGELGITTTAFLVGAYGLVLGRYTGMPALLVGTPVAGRTTPELANLVAVTANLVPVRVDVDDDLTCAAYLRRVQDSLAASLDNSALPFEKVVEQAAVAGSAARHPLVQVAIGVHDQLVPERLRTASLDVRVVEDHGGGSQFDLELFIRHTAPSFAGALEYATSVWRPAEAHAFRADLTEAVRELGSGETERLADVRCIAPDRRVSLDRLHGTTRRLPAGSVDELFRERVRRTPDAVAVRDGDRELTYAELERAVAAQAKVLSDAGVTTGSTVLVAADRSVAEVVAVLGTLWAGAAYVGIEQDEPAARVAHVMSVVRPAAVLGDSHRSARFGSLRRLPGPGDSWRDTPAPLAPDPDRLAYVAFTSGSTGRPKGVCVPHRGVLRLVAGLDEYAPIGHEDRLMRLAPLSFDASTFELFGALLSGATLHIHPPGLPSPAELGRFIDANGLTVVWLTSGLFGLLGEFAPHRLGTVRCFVTGGEVMPPEHVARILRPHAGLVVAHAYGPTENTTFTTVHCFADAAEVEDPLPIGTPIANTQVYVLDHRMRILPPGALGELCVAGDGLATGYFGDEARTAERFGVLSPDVPRRLYRTGDLVRVDTLGRLQFRGRRDEQVKVRGFRVEPGEVRAVLVEHHEVGDAVVTMVRDDSGHGRLLAGCVPAGDGVDVPGLAGFVSARLPEYMCPALWAVVPELPLTVNGKVNRAALLLSARPLADFPG